MNPLDLDADVPPSARHVAHCLQEEGPLTHRELVRLTSLPETTVDDALQRLIEEGYITWRKEFFDARSRRYSLVPSMK